MNFKNDMQSYFKLRNLDERKKKIRDIISQLEKVQKMDEAVTSLNKAEAIIEYCLLIDDNDDRLQQYDRALELVYNSRSILKEKNQVRQLLRSFHLECFIKYHTKKYKDEEASIKNIFEQGGKILEIMTQLQKNDQLEDYDYYSLGCVWRAYGLVLQIIHKSKELRLKQKQNMAKKARELAHKSLELSYDTDNRYAHILSAYIFAYVEQVPPLMLRGDSASTEDYLIAFMRPYEVLFEIAHAYGSIEFEYLALLNHLRLKLERVIYAAGVSEKKRTLLNEILAECMKLKQYENLISLPHLHFYRYEIQVRAYYSIVYFEAVKDEKFHYYISKAINSAEKMKEIYISAKMKDARDKVQMNHILNEVYRMKALFSTSRKEKLEYLKKCEELLLEDEKSSVTWSPQPYSTWRDLSSIYFDLLKVEHDQVYFEKCIIYAKKVYKSALKTDEFKDALFEAYKIALISEDYQNYTLSINHYEMGLNLLDKLLETGKDYPYYHDLKIYIQARLQGVKAKEAHGKGDYDQAMSLYHNASSLLQSNSLYSYEALLYNVYSLFEEASMLFIKENYKETLKILSDITHSFEETVRQHADKYEPQFQYFIDRRAYNLQQLYFESSKTFCFAQSNILQSLIYRNTGDSEKAIGLLKEANTLLLKFTDRDVHIAGYYSFANGLYGLEKSELAIKDSEYRNAAAYLASASDQFEMASQLLSTDERLRQLCEGLNSFCQGWMFALEIMRRGVDLSLTELNTNFTRAHKSFVDAIKDLKMFEKTYNGVSGFEKLLSYVYYSLLFQKVDDPTEKHSLKDKMKLALSEALQYFEDAEDSERYRFTRDLLTALPQLEDVRENVFKSIDIPFAPYTPVFDMTSKIEPTGVSFVVSPNKTSIEVNEEIQYKIQITSDTEVYLKQIDGVFPKKNAKVISGMRFAKNGTIIIDRLLSPRQSMLIEFKIRISKPLHSKKNPQLNYINVKNEKFRAFTTPFTLQVYPRGVLKTGVANRIKGKVSQVSDITEELGITIGEFPIVYHDTNSYSETLAEYYFNEEGKKGKNKSSKELRSSQPPIQQIAFVNPLGDVNILYDLDKYLYPHSITSLLSIIIHEKFGHGFFYQHTTLGKKLIELEYHRKGIMLIMKELEKISNKYATGIQWLCISTLVPNEGFAVWLTLKTLENLVEKLSENDTPFIQEIQHEMDSIKKRILNDNLNVTHEYFTLKYGTPTVNPYSKGYNSFLKIEEKFGELSVPMALKISADIPLTRRQVSRMPIIVKNDKYCADKRLEMITQFNLETGKNDLIRFEDAIKKLIA